MKIAMVSEHASPLAPPGGVDTGGQNVYVAQVASQLARAGHLVDVFTRCDSEHQVRVMRWRRNLRVVHVPAGPPVSLPKERLLDHMEEFGDWMGRFFSDEQRPYDVLAGLDHRGVARVAVPALPGRRVQDRRPGP